MEGPAPSLGWLKPRKAFGALFGLVGGPLAYYTGQKLGGIEFVDFNAAIIALGIAWGAVTPVLLVLAERFNGFAERPDVDGRLAADEGT